MPLNPLAPTVGFGPAHLMHLTRDARTFERALQMLAPAVQVAAGTEEAADGGGHHSHKEDHGRGDACYGLGTLDKEQVPSPSNTHRRHSSLW